MPDSRDRLLPRASQPEVPAVQEEIDPVLLRLNWVIDRARPRYLEVRNRELYPSGSAFVRTYLSGHLNRRFLCKLGKPFPRLGGDTTFHENTLKNASPVSHYNEGNLA